MIINGNQYTVASINNLGELPAEIKLSDSSEMRDETTIAFLGPHSVFSNFHPAAFTENNVRYNCTEQMIQAEKAAHFGDRVTLQKIMRERDPYKIKTHGSRVHGFNKEAWNKVSKDIALRAVKAKFLQNDMLGGILCNTRSLTIVEASKDRLWGTGIHLRDNKALQRDQWRGPGLMNEILEQVRDHLNG